MHSNFNSLLMKYDAKKLKEDFAIEKAKVKEALKLAKCKKNSIDELEYIISVLTKFEKYIARINKKGIITIPVQPPTLTSSYWKNFYKELKHKDKLSRQIPHDVYHNIMLCWSIKNNYKDEDKEKINNIATAIDEYLKLFGFKNNESTTTDFQDRQEYCQNYRHKCNNEKYDIVVKSAEYLLNTITDEKYDIEVFGKKI